MSDRWKKAKEDVLKLVDSQGMPVDPGIVDTVTALRLFNIHTVMSCEGHKEKGHTACVWFEAPDANKDRKTFTKLKEKGAPKSEITQLVRKMVAEEANERQKVLNLLQEFYKAYNPPALLRLAIESVGFCSSLLRSQGSILNASLLDTKKRDFLFVQQQREMEKFTFFLKTRFKE